MPQDCIRAYAEANDVSLHLIDIPFRQEYQAVLVEDEAREMWDGKCSQIKLLPNLKKTITMTSGIRTAGAVTR